MKSNLIIRSMIFPILVIAVSGGSLLAQEADVQVDDTQGHEFLKKFVGKWELKNKGSMGEGQPEMEGTAVMDAKMLGDLWVVCAFDGEVAGMNFRAMQTIGYDSEKEKFVGTWVDSMQTHLWVYEGSLDKSGTKLTLAAEGPNMTEPGKTSKYRDEYEFKGDDQIVASSSMLGDDGKWVTFMKGTATRKKD